MDIKLLIAIISSIIALVSAGITIWGQSKVTKLKAKLDEELYKKKRKDDAEIIISKYRDPLLLASFELQSRIYNIVKQDLLKKFYVNGDEREKLYTSESTLYSVAQYFCWIEIIRRDIQFLDLGERKSTKTLSTLLENINILFLLSNGNKIFRVFRAEQKAIGELMISDNSSHCIGFSKFTENKHKNFRYWFLKLEQDIENLAINSKKDFNRLISLQNALIDLIDYLDPNYIRFSKEHRSKIEKSKESDFNS